MTRALSSSSAALREYAEAWLEEHRYTEKAHREDRALSHSVNMDPPARDRAWADLLRRKEDAHRALGLRDYVEAQELIFETFLALSSEVARAA